jgi:hypothetical protein
MLETAQLPQDLGPVRVLYKSDPCINIVVIIYNLI